MASRPESGASAAGPGPQRAVGVLLGAGALALAAVAAGLVRYASEARGLLLLVPAAALAGAARPSPRDLGALAGARRRAGAAPLDALRLAAVGHGLERRRPRRDRGGTATALLAGWPVVRGLALAALRGRSLQPIRESVALSRGLRTAEDPAKARIFTASFWCRPCFYDPWVREVRSPHGLRTLVAEADAEGLAPFFDIASAEDTRSERPELARLVERPELFEERAVLPAFERRKTRHVYRYRGRGDGRP